MNRCLFIGRVVTDPVTIDTSVGTSLCKFLLAVPRATRNSDGSRDSDFFSVVAWGKLGDSVKNYAIKGDNIGIGGRVEQRKYISAEGVEKSYVQVTATEVDFLGRPKRRKINLDEYDALNVERSAGYKPTIIKFAKEEAPLMRLSSPWKRHRKQASEDSGSEQEDKKETDNGDVQDND